MKAKAWPIALIIFFALFIAFCIGLVVWSTHQREDLVSEKYYDDEIKYQQRIDATKRTTDEGLVPKASFASDAKQIELRFPAPAAMKDAKGTVTLYCPSAAELDKVAALHPDQQGLQQIAATSLRPGLWRVKTEWNTSGKTYYAEDSIIVQ